MTIANKLLVTLVLAAPGLGGSALAAGGSAAVIVELTQVPCQFLESEQGTNHGYRSTKIQDCEAINADDLDYEVRWKSGPDVGALAGKPVRVRITMRNTKLYEMQFTHDAR